MKEVKFYILFFDFRGNAFFQENAVKFIVERLRFYYLKNLMLPLGENTFLVRGDGRYPVGFYIQSAINELSDEMAIGVSEIKHFIIPIELKEISEYIKPWLKEIEVIKQIQ